MSKPHVEDIYPLSPAQQGMLFFLLFSGFEGQVYFDQLVSTVSGRLDVAAWQRAWNRVMERHAALRTHFLWERRDEPLQVVRYGVELPFQVLDWRSLPEPEREERLAAFLREDHDRGFDIGKAPLLRIAVIHWADDVHRFIGSFHHLVLDGWSMGLVLGEALSYYHAFAEGRDLQLPPPRRYRDFIGWVARRDPASAESFWRGLLADLPGRTPLPLDGTGPGGKVAPGRVTREEVAWVAPEATRALNAFARRHQVTPNTLFQAAWCLLLGRSTASSDVVFGTVVSGRPADLEGVESMVGLFINVLPVRVRIDPGAGLIPWLKELQALQVELREHEYCPLELIQGWSGLGHPAGLFDSVLVYENYPLDAAVGGGSSGLAIQAQLVESGSFPLTLYAEPQKDGLKLRLSYHRTRLSPAAARRLATHLVALFDAFAARPQARLGDFTRLAGAEREELLALGAGPPARVSAVAVHRLVEEQAARRPQAVAVEADGGFLTYAGLAARAGRLARHLRRLGVGPESIVGLCAGRSLDMVAGMLGVLAAGAAYLPLDPAYPGERLAFLLADSGARWVLAPSGLAERLPETSAEVVLLDGDLAPDDGAPLPAVDPRHPAYVIYTSGSTGRPKGVLVSHAALAGLVHSAGDGYGIEPADRVLQFASISFDTSAEEIYPCLARGATLVLRGEEMAGSLGRFVRESGELAITVLDLPTAYWHELVAEMVETGLALPPSLRLVILGGEAAQADRLAAWRERVGGGVRLVNTYGPTEATIVSTRHDLTDGIRSTEVPIGRPLPNARTYVVDRGLELVPLGVQGELLIGGAGLARGYLGRPGLTAERFVPDPFSATPGARLYRSGDLVRLLPEGDLEFRGRADDQVKVRGFRIELGEIEAVLRRQAGVRDAVVVAQEDTPGRKRLVAYAVPAGEAALSAFDLRAALGNELPEHMVPSVFVTLAALPLTPSGKVDRRALPAPEVVRADAEAGFAAPRNEVQEVLAGIWSDLLGVERVGIHDDFFQLGGHSLVVARLASRIRQAFKVELPLVEVFHRPTIAGLSEAVQKAERTAVDIPDLPPIRRAPRDRPIPLSFPQERVWFLNQLAPGGNLAYNFQVTIWLRGPLDVTVLDRTLSEIVRRHESLRTSFPTVDGRPVQRIHQPYPVALPVAELRAVPAGRRQEESERVVFEATQTAFDLTSIPLIRWKLLRLDDELWELVQVEHHFVHDGWSFSVILREIKELYEAFLKGAPSPLPELPVQYADFAVWQREWMEGPVMDHMLGYWKRKLSGSPTILELPADRPRPERPAFKGELSLSLMPPDLYAGLRAFGRKNGLTLFMTTLTGFFALLERYTGQADILLGTSNANRRTREVEGLIGMIVNSLVLRGDMQGDPTMLELLGRIRETSLESYAYQDMPLERLVRELRPERQLSRNPLFQLMFGFHDAAVPDLDFGGLKGSFLVRGNRSAKLDMNVIVVPRAEQRVGLASSAADQSAVLHWEYSTELFDGSTVQRMIGHYLTLLRGIVEAPGTPLSALPVLSGQELHQIIREWSGAPAAGSLPACLHETFAERARQTPEAVALTFEMERLSYGELDRRANRLAHRLLAWGIGRGSRVGLCLERSLDLVTGILGILKAGAAYVPLDPAYPQERLAFLVEDSGVEALVTEEKLRAQLPMGPGGRSRVLCLDSDREEIERRSSEPPSAGATARDVAYVIYTSGSTGRPKGVAVPHANVAELLAATADRFGFGPQDVWTLFHSCAFDFSVWELWGALLHGGRLVVVPYWVSRSPEAFYQLLDRERVTVLNQTPSAFRQLSWAEEEAGAAGRRDLALRRVIFGGEALEMGSLRPWFERHGEERPRLVNMYGITETTVHVTYRELGLRDLEAGSVLGRPIPGWKVLLLDRGLSPVAPGVPGEIHVGGVGLALGYLGRAELTAARFVPDPWSGEPGGRLYRSGDLARFRPDGDLEHLGRTDDQVKIRGFRIEPGEIEAVLASHPAVREAAVVVRGHRGDQRLVAYVAAAEPRPAPGELRELVRRRQPEHMVPAVFVLVDRLPLTPNGKVDRRALPEPGPEADRDAAAAFAAPWNPFQEALTLIWADQLGLTRVGIESNFFDLGGDSIQAVRLVSRMNEELGLNFRVQDLFQHQTIAALAAQSGTFAGRTSVEQERAAGLIEIERRCQALLADPRQRASLPDGYEDFFPLSGIEKGMAYYSLLMPEEPVYHDQFVYLLRIAAGAGVFFEALALTMERHPVFRTSYDLYTFAEPIKVVHRDLRLEREVEDLAGLAEPEQRRRVEDYRASDLGRRFTFEGAVLWRFKLFRLQGDLHCAILSFHHAMLDGWSCASLWVEVNNLCARPDRMMPLPPPASTYKDFLAITLGRESSRETAAFWRETLGGVGRNKLPFNRVKVRGTQARGMRTIRRRLDGELLAALRAVALASHVPLRTLTLAAHVWLLHVIAAEDDVVTGVVTNERPEIKDGDKIFGCFLNTIPVRIDAARAAGFLPLLRAVDGYLRRAREHEILLGDIAAAVGHRETADNPFFDTIFNFLDFHILEQAEPHALSETAQAERTAETHDLEAREMTNTLFDLEVITTLGELDVKLKYSPRYFDAADAWRAVDLYVRMLERIAGDSATRLDPEALLSAAERSEVVDRFNDTRVDDPRETPVFRLIEARAAQIPDHPAVSCAGVSLTYRELNQAANRLARHLLRQGARPGDDIGVIHPRSVDLAVALTAVLKMGGAYVPIEPDYPPARKGYIVRSSGVTRIVADRPYELAGLPGGGTFIVPEPAELLVHDGSDLDITPRPDQPAYTIYTSGSTGHPKGVMIEHHSVVNLVRWVNRELAVGPGTTVLMLSSVCFDLSVYDLFGGLSAGARVVLAREEDLQDPERLKRLVAEERITFWSSVPSTMGLLVKLLEEVDPGYRQEDLTVVFLSGDWIPLALPEKIRTFFPNARVISLGGATEGTVWSIFYPVDRVDEAWASIPYGRPIDNNAFYILDKGLSVVPPGVVGDLYIGGAGVAKGYANDPEKTAGSFQPDRFAAAAGARMYRTGDLGRMLPDGNIEFLGRADHQVKIRGFRVELGEVESQLLRHPAIREAVVIDRTDSAGGKYLCAYVVAAELPATPELKAYLATTLPEYMIPAAFIPLPALPLTGNGKLDRRALPDPEVANLSTSARYVAPAGEVEAALAGIWEEVLGIDGIGTSHDFFELGGHSLLAVQVITRIRRKLGVELPLRILFDTPTVAGLSAGIGALRLAGAAPQQTPLGRAGRNRPLPLSFAQQRLWFLDQLDPGSPVYNVPAAVMLTGRLDVTALAAALGEVVLRHEVLRTAFGTVAGEPVQLISPHASAALPVVDLRCLPAAPREREVERLAEAEARRPFGLGGGALLRSALLRLGAGQHAILLTTHHIASDGWSMGVLVREMVTLYGAFATGRPSPLPELPVQYADFAVWQRGWLSGEALERQVRYWRERLAGLPALLDLPLDRPRPASRSQRGSRRAFDLPLETLQDLKELGRRQGVTEFMTLLALFQAFLSRLSGQEDLAVGTVIANRPHAELELLIGFFANTLVMRGDLSGAPSLSDLLVRTRESAMGAYTHQDLPFEHLVEALQPARAASYTPLFQAMLALQNVPEKAHSLPGLEAYWIEGDDRTGSARFDLILDLKETPSGLTGAFEYVSDLFDRTTISRMAGHFATLLEGAVADPGRCLTELPLLAPGERHQLLAEWNDTRAGFPETTLLHQFFEASVERAPEAVAAVCAGEELTYAGLDARSNRLARLLSSLGVERGAPVGVWVERSLDLLTAVLGVLKAGGHYVALDEAWPADRVESILAATGASAVITGSGLSGLVEEMLWRLPMLSDVVCLGISEAEPPAEPVDPESVRELWDLVAERAVDRVTAGGFISAFTEQPMSEAEVDEYRDRVLALAGPWLHGEARVLEVGNGSGLLLWEMASRSVHVTGVDPSPLTQERNREHAAREGIANVTLLTGFAHELDRLIGADERFDLILLASTVQFFPGPRYLERVMQWAHGRLAPGGALLIADVLDARRREELRRAIEEHRGEAGAAPRRELSLDEGFFHALGAAVHHRTEGFANELGFRYDVLLPADGLVRAEERRRRLWTGWHVDRCAAGRLPQAAGPDDIAYVIHTSGSTGEPKGIVVQHRPAAHLIDWINRTFEVGPEDRGLFVTSLCFDLSVYDIFGMLAAGGTIHVATREELGDPGHLVRLLRSGGITLWDSAPAALVQLAPLFPAEPDAGSRLRRVLLSGDWIPVTLPDRVRQAFPRAKVLALGGATEATVWSNWFQVGEVDPGWPSIPYGRPIANARYHVLDNGFSPCPIGVPGDLYIGGACLCAGYRQPELTARAFLPDPFPEAPGGRLYRTGDRVRVQADGNIQFLGRLDQQVKVRGYRIELGEIEVALARHPGLREAVVLVREDEPGDLRLVAYVVPSGDSAPADLRDALRRSLPDYMIPSAFLTLPELPVTPNGKLDRGALPAPQWSAGTGLALPRTPVEETLGAIWASVLGVPQVGREDSFFDLGGHSLLATQMMSRVRETLEVELSLRVLFDRPRLADLAAEIEALRSAGALSTRQPAGGAGRNGPLPLSFAQERFWFLQQLNPDSSAFHLSGAVRLTGRLQIAVLEASFGEIVRRHAAVRTRFAAMAGVPCQIVDPPGAFLLPRMDLSGLGGSAREGELRRVAESAMHRPFRLAAEPPLRVLVLRLADDEHVVLFTLHHIAGDGWSLEILIRELGDLYAAGVDGRPSTLPELPVQYADWAVAHQEWLRGQGAAEQLAWWRRQLGGDLPVLAFPMQRQRPAAPRFRGAAHRLALDADLSAALADLGRSAGATLFMCLLATFKALLHLVTGGEDLLVGTNVANREWPGVGGLIGLFVNDLALRTDLSGRPSFRELLARVREIALEAHARQDLPFEAIVADLRPERSASPLFQVMFVLQSFPLTIRELPGLILAPLEVDQRTANFDLTLALSDGTNGLTGAFVYDVDLFDASTIARLAEHFVVLVREVVADPDRPLHSLSFALPAAAHQMASVFSEEL